MSIPIAAPDGSTKYQFTTFENQPLKAGSYTIDVEQSLQTSGLEANDPRAIDATYKSRRHFSIHGPGFTLDQQQVVGMFPPPHSLGDHDNVLPHIILKPSTLPWLYSSVGNKPWLALLLFDETELPATAVKSQTVAEVSTAVSSAYAEKINHISQAAEERVTVLTLPNSVVRELLPSAADLDWLAHVRQPLDENDSPVGEATAVIMANRLPKQGGVSQVHLVSLTGLFAEDESYIYLNDPDDQDINLISLKSWQFTCLDHTYNFRGLLTQLNHPLLFSILVPPAPPTPAVISGQPSRGGGRGGGRSGQSIRTAVSQQPASVQNWANTLSQGNIPEFIRQAFSRHHTPLSMEAAVSDSSQWQISDDNALFHVSVKADGTTIYNQAGRLLFQLEDNFTNLSGRNLLASLQPTFAAQQHTLSTNALIQEDGRHWWLSSGNDTYFLSRRRNELLVYQQIQSDHNLLRLPSQGNLLTEPFLAKGNVPLPHAMRQGNKTVSWYRGPLVPGQNQTAVLPLPAFSADTLVSYDSEYSLFDLTYAAAWELGRMLILQSSNISTKLFDWKRTHREQLKKAAHRPDHIALLQSDSAADLPQEVTDWFLGLTHLKGVPFNYLLPDERLLPPESIRFFQVDLLWLDALIDGAFSIGRLLNNDINHEATLSNQHLKSVTALSGFLLRSDIVSGWPGLQVDGYATRIQTNQPIDEAPLGKLRLERLSPNILLCLFDGVVQTADIYLRPETIHFGFNRQTVGSGYLKTLRDPQGQEHDNVQVDLTPRQGSNRVVAIHELAGDLASRITTEYETAVFSSTFPEFTSAQFAFEMVEGVPKVRFA